MPAKKRATDKPLTGAALIKETCRRIRVARSRWDARNNRACRGKREKAIKLYESLSDAEREMAPQVLRVWLRYRWKELLFVCQAGSNLFNQKVLESAPELFGSVLNQPHS